MARRNLNHLRAVVTGASSGVGWELALRLARKRVRLILVARRAERLEQLREKILQQIDDPEVDVELVTGNVTDPQIREQICRVANDKLGGLDLLINNAGITGLGRFDQADESRLREIMEVNFFAPAELIRIALPLLKGGKTPAVVNIGSVLGHRAVPLKSEYCASKFALHGLTDALRAELAKDGIDFVLVSPSTIASELFESAIDDSSQRQWKSDKGMKPEAVATRIVGAMERGRHEVIISTGGRMLVWLDRLCPPVMNRIIAKFG